MADSKIKDLTATSSAVDTAEFAANEGLNDRKYTRAEIVAAVATLLSNYISSNDASVALKAPLASPTFTGTVDASSATTTVATPSAGTDATTKTYVDTADALKVPLAGGTMTGLLTLSGAPSASSHASTKSYTDTGDALGVLKAGSTMTGLLVLSGDPSANLNPASKQYTDTADALSLKGPSTLNCAADPNYPASTAFDTIRITGAGKIGGASGELVEIGDLVICHTTSVSGNHATVGGNFIILQTNVDTATDSTEGIVELATAAESSIDTLSASTVPTVARLKDFADSDHQVTTMSSAGPLSLDGSSDVGTVVVRYDAGIATIDLPDANALTNPNLVSYKVIKGVSGAPAQGITFTAAGGSVNTGANHTVTAVECEHVIYCVNDGTDWWVR